MYAFDYARPASLADAVAALRGAEDGKLLAGGVTLLPTMKQRLASPSDLIDLSAVPELKGITVAGDTVTIGAMTTHGAVAASADIASAFPGLHQLASVIGDAQVRNAGTLGGSVANNDPAADYPAALMGTGATVVTDRRRIAADDFFLGLFETALEEDEVIVKVEFPIPEKSGYAKFRNPASRYAMAAVFVAKTGSAVRVAAIGAGQNGVFRVPAMEEALTVSFTPDAIVDGTVPAAGMLGDLHGSPEYRAHLVTVMARRAVAAAA